MQAHLEDSGLPVQVLLQTDVPVLELEVDVLVLEGQGLLELAGLEQLLNAQVHQGRLVLTL